MTLGNLYLIRHGQTIGNGKHYVGWEDLPLNKTGLEQARVISDLLKDRSISKIYSSELNRAMATATPLANQKNLIVNSTALLNEINYGEFQGTLKSELDLKLRKNYRYQQLPEGESLLNVYNRVMCFFETIREPLRQRQNIAIVAHYWSIRLFLGIFQGKDFDDIFSSGGYKPTNGTIFEITYQCDDSGNFAVLADGYLNALT